MMRKGLIPVVALALSVAGIAGAQNPPEGGLQPLPVTTAAAPDTVSLQFPSPAVRTVIETEKPIRGASSGVLPGEPKTAAPVFPSGDVTQKAAPGTQAGTVKNTSDPSQLAVLPPLTPGTSQQPASTAKPAARKSDTYHEELSLFNTPTANLRTMKIVIDDQYNLVGMVYGEELGYIRILNADNNGGFTEIWKSPPLNSPVRGVFVNNLDNTGEAEIVVYTMEGNIFIFGYDSHDLKYKTPDGTYKGINCMLIANLDDTPEKELLFITKPGKMIQFDPVTKFEEWTSTETYFATDMVMGNVDTDRDPEIILNSGEVLNYRFKSVKWRMDSKFIQPETRLYLMDVDSDGMLELIVEYEQGYTRIIDVDQRQEKW
jgi:hypothetical protein